MSDVFFLCFEMPIVYSSQEKKIPETVSEPAEY